jgi:hypothetical protein
MFAMSLKTDSEPSYFYLVMAKSCFRRAVVTSHPHGRGALREIGHDYLAKALPSRDQKGDVAFRRCVDPTASSRPPRAGASHQHRVKPEAEAEFLNFSPRRRSP